MDLALPWSAPGALELLISKFPQFREQVPIGETRIGTQGQLLQSLAGFNVRSLNNLEIDKALKSGEFNGEPLTPEMRANMERELEVREEERKRKGFTISGKPDESHQRLARCKNGLIRGTSGNASSP